MASVDITVATSVLALLRRDVTASCIADRYGVTEAQVLEWQDVFVLAGSLALAEFQRGGKVFAHLGEVCDPDTDGDNGNGGLGPPTTKSYLRHGKGGLGPPTTKSYLRHGKGGLGPPTTRSYLRHGKGGLGPPTTSSSPHHTKAGRRRRT